jgi:hypothetical protein
MSIDTCDGQSQWSRPGTWREKELIGPQVQTGLNDATGPQLIPEARAFPLRIRGDGPIQRFTHDCQPKGLEYNELGKY